MGGVLRVGEGSETAIADGVRTHFGAGFWIWLGQYLRFDRNVVGPVVAAAGIRLGLMLVAYLRTGTAIMTQGDTASYLGPGGNLFRHGVYATAGLPELLPEIDRTPGYPVFAMLTGMAFGQVLLTVLAQIVVAVFSLLLARRIAERVFPGSRAGVLAAWLFALEPVSVLYSVRLMPETLFVLLLLAFLERLLAFQASGRLACLGWAGLWLAGATYVRPVGYYLVFAVALGLALTAGRRDGLWWKAPIVLLVSVLPLLAAWQVRNWLETGYAGFSSIVEKNLYFYQSAEVTAELEGVSLAKVQRRLGYTDEASYLAAHPEQRDWDAARRLRFMHAESTRILREHPGLYMKTHWRGVAVVALTPCATELLQLVREYPLNGVMPRRVLNEGVVASVRRVLAAYPQVALTMVLLEALLLMLYLLAILGLFSREGNRLGVWTLAGVALYFLLISGGAQAVGRYRLPVMPEVCVLAAGGWVVLARGKKMRGRVDLAG